MAVRRQPLAILQDENAEINRGKSTVTKSVGLKAQQPDLSDRITLSNITNKPKPRSSGLVSPIAPRKTENHTKGAFGGTFSSAKNGRAGVAPRTALGDITNGVESCKAPASAVKQKKARGKNAKIGSNPRCELTEEEKQKANAWARERIERVQFSGKDMEVLKAKIAEEVAGKGHGHSVSGAAFEEYKLYDFSTSLQHRVKSSGSWNNIKSCVRDAGVCRKLGQKSVNAASFYQQHLTPIQESTVALMEMRKKSHNIGKKILVAIEISSNALPCEKKILVAIEISSNALPCEKPEDFSLGPSLEIFNICHACISKLAS